MDIHIKSIEKQFKIDKKEIIYFLLFSIFIPFLILP